jgi:CSLREA domain-containing protein
VTQAETIVVNSTADPGPGNCTTTCTLRGAIATAAAGNEVTFSVTGTITLSGMQLTINKDLTLTGPGAGSLAVSGNNASRVMQINTGVTAALSGLTIRGGNIIGDGGDILNRANATLTLTDVTLSGNFADRGGGIFNDGPGTLTLTDVTLSDNSTSTISTAPQPRHSYPAQLDHGRLCWFTHLPGR